MKNMLIGIMSGLVCGMFSAGGGLILVPAFVYILKLNEKQARATAVFCILPMVVVTTILYSMSNFVNWQMGIKCAIGGTIGGFIGGKILNRIPTKYLKISFIIFLIYAGISMILK